jgi:hypothetical protein
VRKLKRKNKRHLISQSRRSLRLKYRNKQFRRLRCIQKEETKSLASLLINSGVKTNFKREIVLTPEADFTVDTNIDGVISFLRNLKKCKKRKHLLNIIKLDLEQITKIDIVSICMLLSVVEELSFYRIEVSGNIPKNKVCEEMFIDSGFLAHMKSLTGNTFQIPQNRNLIIKSGKDQTHNEEIGECIKNAMEFLTGKKRHYQPVYSIIMEINGNSVEHAYERNKHWLLGINFDKFEKKVIFTFADNGFGILKTLNRKFGRRFFEAASLKDNGDILNNAFQKKYGSRHDEQINRNKGLPLLKKIQNQGKIKNLKVITNNVLLQLQNESYILLNKEFSGTYYYWEMDLECVDKDGRKNNI